MERGREPSSSVEPPPHVVGSEPHVGESESDDSDHANTNGDFQLYRTERQKKKQRRQQHEKDNTRVSPGNSDSESESDNDPRPTSDIFLYFPRGYEGNERAKKDWVTNAYKEGYDVRIRQGKRGILVTTRNEQVATQLTTVGFSSVVLDRAPVRENTKKIIIVGIKTVLDIEDIVNVYPQLRNLQWNNQSRYKEEIIGWCLGPIPDCLIIPPYQFPFTIREFVPRPILCGRCSAWGHGRNTCQKPPKCRYCAGDHLSAGCAEAIQGGQRIQPCCTNCGQGHNANSITCIKNPGRSYARANGAVQGGGATDLYRPKDSQPVTSPVLQNPTPCVWNVVPEAKEFPPLNQRPPIVNAGIPTNKNLEHKIEELQKQIEEIRSLVEATIQLQSTKEQQVTNTPNIQEDKLPLQSTQDKLEQYLSEENRNRYNSVTIQNLHRVPIAVMKRTQRYYKDSVKKAMEQGGSEEELRFVKAVYRANLVVDAWLSNNERGTETRPISTEPEGPAAGLNVSRNSDIANLETAEESLNQAHNQNG